MACEYCLEIGGRHNPRCPNSPERKSFHYCSICGESIYDGEEYVENDDGDYRHLECFDGFKELLKWLGYDVKTVK